MKTVTIALSEETARWVRARAAEQNRSASSWLAEQVERMRRGDDRASGGPALRAVYCSRVSAPPVRALPA